MKFAFTFILCTVCVCNTMMASRTDSLGVLPLMYKVLGPTVYRSAAVRNAFKLEWEPKTVQKDKQDETEGMRWREKLDEEVNRQLFSAYMMRPTMFRYHEGMIEGQSLVNTMVEMNKSDAAARDKAVDKLLSVDRSKKDVMDLVGPIDVGLEIERPNFWETACEFTLQYTQNYFSEMWYKGANNNMNFLSTLNVKANYDDQKKVRWENTLQMRLGFINSKSDTVHSYIPSDNRLYLQTKLGIKAVRNFYYTISSEAETQMMNGYKVNDTTKYSMFMAPLDVFVSVGMDFKPKLKNNNSFSASLWPLSYKLRYVRTGDDVIIKEYKLRDGKRNQSDFGSKAEAKCQFTIVKNLVWKSRLSYYTNYKYVEAEWENSLTFAFNRYLQTEIYTLWRFDDNRDMKYWDEKLGFFQFREYFTLGLAYKF